MWNIVLLGLVSFFSDVSSEMVYPIIPLYLTSVFGATPALVGVIEGIAESVASLLKVFSGYFTDKKQNKKAVAFSGYAAGIVYKGALLLVSGWPGILISRVIDRIGKGIRTAPRDVLVSESAGDGNMGRAFGIHKALDMAGSALGIALAWLFMRNAAESGIDYKRLFLISIIPAALGLAAMLFVKERKKQREIKQRERFWTKLKSINGDLKLYLAVVGIFTLGNSSNTFLLLRAKGAGFDDSSVVLLYFIYNITAAALSVPFGRLSDSIGRKKLLIAGYTVFSLVYAAFAISGGKWVFIAAFAVYGIYTALTAGVERAMIAEISPPELKGTMLGLHSTIVGVALLPASIIAGLLYDSVAPFAPFALGAVLSLAAAVMLAFLMGKKKA